MLEVLVVDDEPSILESVRMYLSEKGLTVFVAKDGREGWETFQRIRPRLVILDVRLPDSNGIELLRRIKASSEETKAIMITAYHEMQTAIEAMKGGAFDYILKPIDLDSLDKAIERVLKTLSTHSDQKLSSPSEGLPDVLIGSSPSMVEVQKTIGMVCTNNATVLIQGETGTGKELVARVIHQNSTLKDGPFVVFDCAGVVENLLESELFGHEKGAFTGALFTKKGAIERAERGTLFLDEVSELPFGLQGKLLGFLQRKEFMRVGGQ
ncbi:MAG: sigma-54-dependent transcriptional regulator, partial [Desulfatiglandales bacterium]